MEQIIFKFYRFLKLLNVKFKVLVVLKILYSSKIGAPQLSFPSMPSTSSEILTKVNLCSGSSF